MTRKTPHIEEPSEKDLVVGDGPKSWAAGVPGVYHSMKRAIEQMGVNRTRKTVMAMNQKDGFDCPGCAWPGPGPPAHCRVLRERRQGGRRGGDPRPVGRGVLRRALGRRPARARPTTGWASRAGSPSRCLRRRRATTTSRSAGTTRSRSIADELAAWTPPTRRSSTPRAAPRNEAAFLYQLFVRALRHQQPARLLEHVPRVAPARRWPRRSASARARVSLDDVATAELIIVVGQNPGTNHPRMLTALEAAKRNGAKIVAINPLPEAGLLRFKNPQTVRGRRRPRHRSSPTSSCQIRIGGDLALFQADRPSACSTPRPRPRDGPRPRLRRRAHRRLRRAARRTSPGWTRHEVLDGHRPAPRRRSRAGRRAISRLADSTIICWAMGITQHRNAVATIQEIVNLLLLRGNIGKPGAGSARCAATPTCRATAPWASGSSRRSPSSTPSATSSASSRRASTGSTPSTRSGRCATARPRSSSGWAATSSRAIPDTDGHRGGDAQRRADRAGLDQAQPLARRAPAARR